MFDTKSINRTISKNYFFYLFSVFYLTFRGMGQFLPLISNNVVLYGISKHIKTSKFIQNIFNFFLSDFSKKQLLKKHKILTFWSFELVLSFETNVPARKKILSVCIDVCWALHNAKKSLSINGLLTSGCSK